ncbi:Stk1 family PASTA domain-containing Ser/Thr kinase [Halobacillus fulvus]|nr:Stk1 family PASTA domain-containing Ser/Thr kinase [Halobacillus fulvus]
MLNDRLLNDRYRVQDMVGGGGMANVYLAHDTILERDVAIKVLRLEHGNDEEFIARFHREAQSATSLSHPNIVSIFDVGEEDDIYYMVMEYVDGMTLKQYIQQNSPIDVAEAVDIMMQVTSAISHAHDNGIVHRDIKPQNILIDQYGHVKVTDFGIAMALSATALTQTNSVLGSVHYLSPEQARGGMATKKSDVYALGIVFFELLTGRLPFSGESPVSIALKHLQHDTPSLKRWISDLPQSVENIVLKATAKDPFHRFGSVEEMEEALEMCLQYDRMDEPVFTIPDDGEEKTKAIPVITNEKFGEDTGENTIIHGQTGSNTIVRPPQGADEQAEKKPKKKRKKWPWIVSILAVLFIGGLIAIFTIPGIIQPANVEMVDVTDMEYEEAYSTLRDLNLEVERETIHSDEVEEGFVVQTDPEAGMVVKEGSVVTVFSSMGRERVAFEDYRGENYEEVRAMLLDEGYKSVNKSESPDPDVPEGEILGNLIPAPQSEIIPEDTDVVFQVSSGPPMVTAPSVQGRTEEEAINALEEVGLQVNVEEDYSDLWPAGQVILQDPQAGQVRENSTVTITVSLGPEEPDQAELPDTEDPEEEPAEEPRNETVEIPLDFDEESDQEEQQVRVYIGDMNHDISEVFREQTITEDTSIEATLTISPDVEGQYSVQRGDEVILDETISY